MFNAIVSGFLPNIFLGLSGLEGRKDSNLAEQVCKSLILNANVMGRTPMRTNRLIATG